jgi:hypothetical protein
VGHHLLLSFEGWVLNFVPWPPVLSVILQVAINKIRGLVKNEIGQVHGLQDPRHSLLLDESSA